MPGREKSYFLNKKSINLTEIFMFNFIFISFKRQNNKTECFMDSPCLSNMLSIVKQQSYIDLKRTGVETLGDRKHFSWQSTNGK